MGTIFIKSENSKTSEPDRLLLNLSYKIDLKRSDKYVAWSNLSMYYTWKNIKTLYKYPDQHEAKHLKYLMDLILYQIFKIILILSTSYDVYIRHGNVF